MKYLYSVEVKGMMCEHCESHVNDAVRKALKAKGVKSSHDKQLTTFETRKIIKESDIREAIESAGYEVGAIKVNEQN